MKNIHILPTDKPSRFFSTAGSNGSKGGYCLEEHYIPNTRQTFRTINMFITSDEEIKEGYYMDLTHNIVMKSVFYPASDKNCKKIILTTDQDLIKDGVQPIDDEFIEWFVKHPSCEFVEVKCYSKYNDGDFSDYKIIFPKEEINIGDNTNFGVVTDMNEKSICFGKNKVGVDVWYKKSDVIKEPKQETLEDAADKWVFETNGHKWSNNDDTAGDNYGSFISGAKWRESQYTTEEQHVGHSIGELEKEYIKGFNEGAEYQSKQMYSEEEVKQKIIDYLIFQFDLEGGEWDVEINRWFEIYKKK